MDARFISSHESSRTTEFLCFFVLRCSIHIHQAEACSVSQKKMAGSQLKLKMVLFDAIVARKCRHDIFPDIYSHVASTKVWILSLLVHGAAATVWTGGTWGHRKGGRRFGYILLIPSFFKRNSMDFF